MTCKDHNGTILHAGMAVMAIDSAGSETEGIITLLHENNQVTVETECGCIRVNAADCYELP